MVQCIICKKIGSDRAGALLVGWAEITCLTFTEKLVYWICEDCIEANQKMEVEFKTKDK